MKCIFSSVLVAVTLSSQAAELTIPNTFTAGTPAKAAEVNANFNAVKSAVDDKETRVTSLETDNTKNKTDISTLKTDVSGNSSAITTLQSNMNGKQAILSSSCAVGSAIRAIAPNGAVTCDAFEKSGKLSLQPTEFQPTSENFAVVGNCQAIVSDYASFSNGTLSSCSMFAAAHFPQGATITSFQCFVYDSNTGLPAARVHAQLQRMSLSDTTNNNLAETDFSGSTSGLQTISAMAAPINNVVDNNNYYYRVYATFEAPSSTLSAIGFGNLALRNCTADYTMP